TWRLATNLAAAELDSNDVLVINDWRFDGVGYANEAERELAAAIATRIRQHRALNHRKDTDHAQPAQRRGPLGHPRHPRQHPLPVAHQRLRATRRPHRQTPPLPARRRQRLAQRTGGGLMARVWVYDRIQSKKYRDAVAKAKAAKRKPPNRYLVMYYDKTGKQRSESVPTRARADLRVAELSSALLTGTYTDPVVAKVKFAEVAEKWLESRTRIKPSTW